MREQLHRQVFVCHSIANFRFHFVQFIFSLLYSSTLLLFSSSSPEAALRLQKVCNCACHTQKATAINIKERRNRKKKKKKKETYTLIREYTKHFHGNKKKKKKKNLSIFNSTPPLQLVFFLVTMGLTFLTPATCYHLPATNSPKN